MFFTGTETHPGAPPTGTNQSTAPLGGGAVLNIGYALKQFVSFEGTFAFMGETHTDSITPENQSTIHFKYGSVNGFVGAGARITSHTDVIRFTFGTSFGAAIRNYAFSLDGATAPFDSSASYTAPGLMLDGGMLLGSTPGAKFYLGGLLWVDFPPEDLLTGSIPATAGLPAGVVSTSDSKMLLSTGTQVYVGPMLGVQFGH
jgi:hypothetical protein